MTLEFMTVRRWVISLIAALYFGLIATLCFVAFSDAPRDSHVWPFGLFIPVGALLFLLFGRHRWWLAVGFGVLGAAWMEAGQTVFMPEGYASVWDILAASIGSTLGVLIAMGLTSPHRHRVTTARHAAADSQHP